jgi:hypothetical protein
MRILVVGTLPPPGGDAARALADSANSLRDEGHDIELLSPDFRSAAHRHARLDGPLLAAWLGYLSSRFDAVVLRFEPGFPLRPHTSRALRAATLFALGAALQRYDDVTIRFDGGPSIPLGLGGRAMGQVWQATTRIIVASEDKRAELIAASGLGADAVTVSTTRGAPIRAATEGWSSADEDALRIEVSALVRERADRARAADRALEGFVADTETVSRAPLSGETPRWSVGAIFREAWSAARVVGRRIVAASS